MKIVLTGGIACGKSLIAKFLSELGIRLMDADDVVHELEGPGGKAVGAIVGRFGEGVLKADGGHEGRGIDRKRLGEIVFENPEARRDLEAILFPLVRKRIAEFVSSSETDSRRIAIIPLLFESHWETDFDIILCIASSVQLQMERMVRTRGYSRAHAGARLAAQMPVSEKAARSHYVIWNDSTPEHLREEAARLVDWLKDKVRDEC